MIIRKSAMLAAALGACLAPAALAETMNFQAQLSGKNESPPNDSPASGAAAVTYDTDTKTLAWKVEYRDLTGDAIGAHIHGAAQPGANAGVMIPFKTLPSPIEGSAVLNEDQIKSLMDGRLYVNVHTAQHPGGELRGQLTRQ